LNKRLEDSALTWEEGNQLFDLGLPHPGGYVTNIISYETALAEGKRPLHEAPIYYKDLQGGCDVATPAEKRKRFMPLITRDWSKQAYDEAVRQEEHQAFMREHYFGKEIRRPTFGTDEWKNAVSVGMLASNGRTEPLSEAEKKANHRAYLKGFDNVEAWKKHKKEKAEEKKQTRKNKNKLYMQGKRTAEKLNSLNTGQEDSSEDENLQ